MKVLKLQMFVGLGTSLANKYLSIQVLPMWSFISKQMQEAEVFFFLFKESRKLQKIKKNNLYKISIYLMSKTVEEAAVEEKKK